MEKQISAINYKISAYGFKRSKYLNTLNSCWGGAIIPHLEKWESSH